MMAVASILATLYFTVDHSPSISYPLVLTGAEILTLLEVR